MVTLCPDDFSKSGISAAIAGCKATAHRSLISAALAVLPAVMPNKASPKAIVAETLRMLRRFILSLHTCVSVGVSGIPTIKRSGRRFAPSRREAGAAVRQRIALREDRAELRLVRRTCSWLHLDQIRPHGMA